MKVGVSIIIPTRNEADNIGPLFTRLQAVIAKQRRECEIVVVDDSSTDDTRQRVRQWAELLPVRLICRDDDGCLAGAVIAGARQAQCGWAVILDADLSHPPELIFDLVAPLEIGTCDMVIGSRYVAGGATPHWPLRRRIASWVASLPAKLFTDVKDPMAGFFATSTARIRSLRDDVPGFKIGLELLAAGGSDMRVMEIPIVFQDRFEGFSKMNRAVALDYGRQLLQLTGISSPLFQVQFMTGAIGSAALAGWLAYVGIVLTGGGSVAGVGLSLGAIATVLAAMMGGREHRGAHAVVAPTSYRAIMAMVGLLLGFCGQTILFSLLAEFLNPLFIGAVASVVSATLLYITGGIFVFSELAECGRRPRLRAATVVVLLTAVSAGLALLLR